MNAETTFKFSSTFLALSLSICPAWAELQGRDLNGDSFVDALYDTNLNVTWLRNANANGLMTWSNAQTWVNSLSVHGVTGWRLPASDACTQYECNSEMAQLWRQLGNQGSPVLVPGSFQNFLASSYWSGTTREGDQTKAYYYNTYVGAQGYIDKGNSFYAMAVHAGDVSPVPEPASLGMLIAGILVIGLRSGKRKSNQESRESKPDHDS